MQELCGCHWSHSQDTDVVLSITSMRKQLRAGRKGENGSFSGKCPVLGQRLCLLFLLKCHGLRTCKPFIFYFWCFCLARLFSTTFFPLPTIVKLSSLLLPCVSESFPIICIQAPHRAWSILTMKWWPSTIEIIPLVKEQHEKALISKIPYGIISDVEILVKKGKWNGYCTFECNVNLPQQD